MARTALLVLVLGAGLAACGGASPPGSSPGGASVRPVLLPVTLPDVSSAAAPVQRQIRDRHAALQAVVARADASGRELASAYGDMGKLFIAAEYYEAAGACFDNARALDPSEMQWPYFRGHVYRFGHDTARAAESFEVARRLAPSHVPTLVWLSEMYLMLDRPADAERLLSQARALDPRSGAVFYGLGRAALARRDFSQAVVHLEQALGLAPDASRVHYPLALAYRGLGDRARAEAHLRQRGEVDLPPADPLMGEVARLLHNASAVETRGVQAMDARQWPEAVARLQEAVALAPDDAPTRLNLGTSLYMSGRLDEALEQYRAAVRLAPDLARAHFGIGAVLEAGRRDDEAIAAYDAAVRHDPGYLEARFNLANALRRRGRVEESLPHYAEILRASPGVSQASFGYAMGLVRLGRYREARDRLEEAAAAFPDQAGFAHALARLLAAAPDDAVRDGARALSLMTGLLAGQQTLALAETMAMALAEVGRFDEAAQWQRDVIEGARQTGRPDLVPHLDTTLRRYEQRRPCRTPWTDDDPVHHPTPAAQ